MSGLHLFPCPNCGSLVDPSSDKCPNCKQEYVLQGVDAQPIDEGYEQTQDSNQKEQPSSEMQLRAIIPEGTLPSDLRWYDQKTNKHNNFTTLLAHISPALFNDIPLSIYTEKFLRRKGEDSNRIAYRILEYFYNHFGAETPPYDNLRALLYLIVDNARIMETTLYKDGQGMPLAFWYVSHFDGSHIQNTEILRLRNMHSEGRTLAHVLALNYKITKWLPQDRAVLNYKYLDSDSGMNVSVRQTLSGEGVKSGLLNNIGNNRATPPRHQGK